MKLRTLIVIFCALVFEGSRAVWAQVPGILNYQGRLVVEQVAFTGVGQFKFALVNGDGTEAYWRNSADGDSDEQPDSGVLVAVSRGMYSVLLGDTNIAQMAALPATVFTNAQIYLRVWFTDGAGAFERLGPDQRLAAVGFAVMAGTVPEGSITAGKLAPGALVASNLVGSLEASQIPELDAAKISSGILDPARIPELDAGKVTGGTLDAARLPMLDASRIGTGTLAAERVPGLDGSKIVSGTISAARLPGLDASQVVSGQLNPTILPQNVAYTDTDLVVLRNELSAEISGLNQRVDALSSAGGPVSAGATAVSAEASDPALTANGFGVFMNVPAPGWISSVAAEGLSGRYEHAAIWAENLREIFVWGGQLGANTFSGAGARYRVDTDQWQPVTSAGAPSARRGHTMVFDGAVEALVWGGFGEAGYLSTGARFDLTDGTWTPISDVNAPAARDGHVTACAAPVMTVWGGRNSAGPLGDGAFYNTATDLWEPVPTADAPLARWGASGVWTGTRLLIWGGVGTAGEVGTGGQLLFQVVPEVRPVQWTGIPTLNAPSARTGHAAVWTGSRMIVWGGRRESSFFNDGALFDPVTGIWTGMASTGAPAARAEAVAVWTGQEMLVFGGENSAGALATGAAYNPVTNRWRPLSSLGNPVARTGATAAWTGSEMVLFGGRANALSLAALQRLTPQPTWYFYRKL